PSRPHRSGDRTPADWCRYYLQFWPNHDLPYDLWWATLCTMHRAGLPIEEARAWSASSSKHSVRKFDSQWEKVARRHAGYGIEWLGAITKGNRPGGQAHHG
ncbi:MAG: PriCT-2 domain-containing protein, partial [Cyanobacteriota bacterium]|nr:PriCT-2 domain-containing protein [Cyanobacteriota bacterium]